MRIVERVTRGKASRFVWGGSTLLCALGLVYAVQGEERALQNEIEAANARTTRYANTVVHELVSAPTVASPDVGFRFRDMLVAAQAEVFAEPTVVRMRLWDPDGVLRFSTDQPRADIGSLQVDDPRVDEAALEGRSTFTQTTEPFTQATTGRQGEPTRLLQTFVPLNVPDRIEPLGAVQIDYLYDALVEASREPWLQVQVLACAALGLFMLMTLLSLRKPIQLRDSPSPPSIVTHAVPVASNGDHPEPTGAAGPAVTDEDTSVAASDAATELRARLARTAATKKLGPNVTD